MSDERLTSELAVRAMGYRLAPGRYLKPGRGWASRSAFRPLVDVKDAFRVLDAVSGDYSLLAISGGRCAVEVRISGRAGRATGRSRPRAICLAVEQALGIGSGEAL